MKHYKLWIQIEEYDSDTDTYTDLCDAGIAAPVAVGLFDSAEEAVAEAEALGDTHYYGGLQWTSVPNAEL